MKIPESRSDRIKFFIVVGLAAALSLLGIAEVVVVPLMRSWRTSVERLAQCQEGLRLAHGVIARVPIDRQRNREALAEITSASEKFILQPMLGNYVLPASEIIEMRLAAHSLTMDPMREIGITDVPLARPKDPRKTLSLYTARVSSNCGYNELVDLIADIEGSNPYICIANLTITGDAKADPEHHRTTFDVQWPIWVDNQTTESLKSQLVTDGMHVNEE